MDTLKLTWRDPDDAHTCGVWFNGCQLWWWTREDATQFEPPGARECRGVQTPADFQDQGTECPIPPSLLEQLAAAVAQSERSPPDGFAPLCWHDAPVIRAALSRGADPLAFDGRGFQALHRLALTAPDLELARELLDAGASGLDPTRGGDTALSIAAARGRCELVRLFVSEGEVPAEQLDRALYSAIVYGTDWAAKETTALALLEAGADPGLPHVADETAFTLAAHAGLPQLLRTLLDGGHADLTATSRYGQGVVLLAVPTSGRPERERALRVLIEAGADVNARTESGYGPLDEAARMGCVTSARLLVEAGAERRARTFESGRRHGNPELDALLRPEST